MVHLWCPPISLDIQVQRATKIITHGNWQMSSLEYGLKMYGGIAISNKYVLNCFTKVGQNFRRLNYNREFLPDCWRSYEESRFAYIEENVVSKRVI